MIQFFMLKLNGGLHVSHHHPKIWITVTWRTKDRQIWNLVYKIVQNEYKIMIQFFILKLHFGGAAFHQPPKFALCIAQEWTVYKIWNLVYKISSKLWYSFLCWNCN